MVQKLSGEKHKKRAFKELDKTIAKIVRLQKDPKFKKEIEDFIKATTG